MGDPGPRPSRQEEGRQVGREENRTDDKEDDAVDEDRPRFVLRRPVRDLLVEAQEEAAPDDARDYIVAMAPR